MPPRARDSPLRSSRASEAESPGNAPAITDACAVVREDPVDVLDPRRQRDGMRRELVGRIRVGARAHRVPCVVQKTRRGTLLWLPQSQLFSQSMRKSICEMRATRPKHPAGAAHGRKPSGVEVGGAAPRRRPARRGRGHTCTETTRSTLDVQTATRKSLILKTILDSQP